ncbi:MAG: endonuclease III [Bacteroidetes bacterium]|nr:endonuclease III [Bacteroidota bacterium]MBT4409488.1 endonuclease III [Bacteroidota bacterium]MBT7466331.1 endonuclease III [Bacteroidota bacterium]
MRKKERYTKVVNWFQTNMPIAETELNYKTPYELMVSVILSAQCTDKRVNLITPSFFVALPDLVSLANASQDEVFEIIRSCSYPNNKAKHLRAAANTVISDFNGEIPETVDELQKIPGVGRKTANVIASVAFNKQAFAVDTHVHRVANRIGLASQTKTPLATENQLTANIEPELWPIAHHWLILHGRYVCKARKPLCTECDLKPYCRYYEKNESKK